jgi:PhoH-like ATPase
MSENKIYYDTSGLLNGQEKCFENPFIISIVTLKELEHMKTDKNKDFDIKYKTRNILRLLDANEEKYTISYQVNSKKPDFESTNDNIIIESAVLQNNLSPITFCTDDLAMKTIAKARGLKVISSNFDFEAYCGYKDVVLSNAEIDCLNRNLTVNVHNCLINEYLVVRNTSKDIIGKYRWNGELYIPIKYKSVPRQAYLDKTSPRNLQQELAFDMLQNRNIPIKVISGIAGSGKDHLMIAHALNLVESGKFDKVIWLKNNIEVENTKAIGFLPGSFKEKLMPHAMIMADHIGGRDILENDFIATGKVELDSLGLFRGRSVSKSIIYCSEAENITREHAKLLISRLEEDSELWINGDWRQADSQVFRDNSGLRSCIEKLKGHNLFGYIHFDITERSAAAKLAEIL